LRNKKSPSVELPAKPISFGGGQFLLFKWKVFRDLLKDKIEDEKEQHPQAKPHEHIMRNRMPRNIIDIRRPDMG
jgi:hypothetical protein